MPKRRVFKKFQDNIECLYGTDMTKTILKEIRKIRPTLEKIAEDNPKVECFFAPNTCDFPTRLDLAASYRGRLVHHRLNMKQEVEYAERQSISLGEHFANLLKDAIEKVKNPPNQYY